MTTLREAYDMVDRFLRNNLCDDGYADYSEALELLSSEPPQRKPLTDGEIMDLCAKQWASHPIEVARVIEAAHGIGGEE
jgi:hypothetical protein